MVAKRGVARSVIHGKAARPSWEWQKEAACRGEDLVLFFGPGGEQRPEREIRERKARAVCCDCRARIRCLDYAIANSEQGFWGGMSDDERGAERRRRSRRAAAARGRDDAAEVADEEPVPAEAAS